MFAMHGSYFGYNFGDTLLCALFTRWMQQASGESVNLPRANKTNQLAIHAESRGMTPFLSTKGVLFCGGGYFGEPKSGLQKWAVRNYIRHIFLAEVAMLMGKPIAIMGAGVGPISAVWLRKKIIRLFNAAQIVVVRDNESAEYLKKHGFTGQLQVASDAAISLKASMFPKQAVSDAKEILKPAGAKKKVFIHLQNITAKQDAAVFETIASFLNKHAETVMPVIITDSKPRKFGLLPQQITARNAAAQFKQSIVWEYNGEPWTMCALINEADLVITNKLHVGIVGTALHKFAISLPHHQKTPRFYNQMALGDRCIMVEEGAPAKVRKLLENWWKGEATDFTTLDTRAEALPYAKLIKEFVKACSKN